MSEIDNKTPRMRFDVQCRLCFSLEVDKDSPRGLLGLDLKRLGKRMERDGGIDSFAMDLFEDCFEERSFDVRLEDVEEAEVTVLSFGDTRKRVSDAGE